MFASPSMLLLCSNEQERLLLQSQLLAEYDPAPTLTLCVSVRDIAVQLRQRDFDVLLIVTHAAAVRRLLLEPSLCNLALGGPQPLLLLRGGATESETPPLPCLHLDTLNTERLRAAIDDAQRRRRTLRDKLRGEIAHALLRGEMELRYQPVLDMEHGALNHAEVLLRWRHPLYGLMGPEHFLDVAEASGAIHPLGVWILRRAHEQQLQWLQQGLPLIPLSINVADCQLEKEQFGNTLNQCLQRNPNAALGLEMSGESLARCSGELRQQLTQWHERGVYLTADHIGAGQTAAALQGLPLDALKLDRSLLDDCENNPERGAALRSALELGQSLGFDTIAAGVENDTTARYLHRQHCDRIQGFWVARPLSGDELAIWARRRAG